MSEEYKVTHAKIKNHGKKAAVIIFSLIFFNLGFVSNALAGPLQTPFGITVNAANHPDNTAEDAWRALLKTGAVGGYGSFIWNWSFQAGFDYYERVVPLMHMIGLKSFAQFSPNFLGAPSPPNGIGQEKSYADEAVRAKFLEDVARLAELHPHYLALGTEINLMFYFHPDEFDNFIPLYREAYDLVKAISPETQVGPTYLYRLFVFKGQFHLPDVLGPHDFLAFSTYPDWWVKNGYFNSSQEFPPDYYGQIREVFPDTPIVFSEVGWPSVGDHSSEEEQAIFVSRLPELFAQVQPDVVLWTLLHDTSFFQKWILDQDSIDFLESLGVNIDQLFNGFNGMGLCNRDGTFKPSWDEAILLDFSPVQ